MCAMKRELERLRDQVTSNDIKVKWVENKLKAEVESHKVSAPQCSQLWWLNRARRDETRRDETRRDDLQRRDETRRDETRRDETRRDETRRDETRRDETRQAIWQRISYIEDTKPCLNSSLHLQLCFLHPMYDLKKAANGEPTELIFQVAPLYNSGCVPLTGSIPLPHYAPFIHYIQHLLTHVLDMPYSVWCWWLKYLKDELKQN